MSINQEWVPFGWTSANAIDAWTPSHHLHSKNPWDNNFPLDTSSPLVAPPELSSLEFSQVDSGNAWEPINAQLISPRLSPQELDNLDSDWESQEKSDGSPNLKRNIDIEAELNKQNLYKTEMCRSWVENGLCRYGTKCQFAHGHHEVRPVLRHPKYKTEICKTFHSTGTCPYGKRCRFIHHPSENPDVKVANFKNKQVPFQNNSNVEISHEETELVQEIGQRLAGLKLSLLAPDPVFNPIHLEIEEQQKRRETLKKGSRLPFFQKLRNKKHL